MTCACVSSKARSSYIYMQSNANAILQAILSYMVKCTRTCESNK